MPRSIKLQEGNSTCFHILQLGYYCFSLCYYPLELEIAGKNSKLLPLFCQNPVVLQSFVMDKPGIETIREKSQPGSVVSELICILNWNCLMGETFCKYEHRQVISNSTFSSAMSFRKRLKPQWEPLQGPECCTSNGNKKHKLMVLFHPFKKQ